MSDSSTPSSSTPSSPSTPSASSPPTPPNLHQNSIDPSATWLVQKFGGTSVGKFAAKIAEDIVPAYLDQHKVAIVCSARSGSTKALGTTNLLLRAASEALRPTPTPSTTPGTVTPLTTFSAFNFTPVLTGPERPRNGSLSRPDSPSPFTSTLSTPSSPIIAAASSPPLFSFSATVDLIKSEHIKAARANINDPSLLKDLENEIESDCEGLRSFLFAAQIIDEISLRSKDNIVGVGERLACKLVAAILRDRGIDSEVVSLENIVPSPDEFDDSQPSTTDSDTHQLSQSFYDKLSTTLGARIRQCGSRVPVVTGFFGPIPGSLLRQVGRGYTDLLAALLSVGLEASELQIWKEVDGIFTADPRKVPTARLIPIISPDEAAELTYYGSEVIHPFTMEQVIRKKIPIRIKNVENPSGGGTVIHPDPDIDAAQGDPITPTHSRSPSRSNSLHSFSPSPLSSFDDHERARRKRLPTAVTIKDKIVVLNINSNRKTISHGFLAKIFSNLDRFGVVVDLISTSEVHVSMAIEDSLGKKVLDRLVSELRKSGTVSVHTDMAILSLVGKQMRHMIGIAGRMFTTLADGNVNIEMISQGASEINISCVILARDAAKALNLIHQSCLQIKPEGARGRVGPWLF